MQFKAVIPKPIRPAVSSMYFPLWRLVLKLRCWQLDRRAPRTAELDRRFIPPALLRFKVGETTDLAEFLAVGQGTARAIETALDNAGAPFHNFESILDFGCGCGRTMIWLLKEHPRKHFHGSDVDVPSIEWCRSNLTSAVFSVNGVLPPLHAPDGAFDLVYSISVFTHLNEEHQRRWLSELHRVIRPGGFLLFTVHGEQTWSELPAADREVLQRAGFLFKTSSKLRGIVPEWYHTAWHSRDYVTRAISDARFQPFAYVDGGLGYQDLIIARK